MLNEQNVEIIVNDIETNGKIKVEDNSIKLNLGITKQIISFNDVKAIDKNNSKGISLVLSDNSLIILNFKDYLILFKIIDEFLNEKKNIKNTGIKCYECGEYNDPNSNECYNCGCPIKKTHKKKNRKKYLIPTLLFLSLFLITIILVVIIPKINEKTKNNKYTDASCFIVENGIITNYDNDCPKNVVIPDIIDNRKIIEIGENAFYNKKIKSVILPKYLKKIRKRAFSDNKIEELVIPNSVKKIYSSAFMSNKIKKLVLGKNITLIGSWSFDFNNIKYLEIPDSVTDINYEAFANNDLSKIIIGNNVSKIEYAAFGQYDWDDNWHECEQNQKLKTIVNKSGNSFDWYDILSYDDTVDGPELWLETGTVIGHFGTIEIVKD